jgi:hypothetical protein
VEDGRLREAGGDGTATLKSTWDGLAGFWEDNTTEDTDLVRGSGRVIRRPERALLRLGVLVVVGSRGC